jgi:uncharacterized protein (DUF2267 family)
MPISLREDVMYILLKKIGEGDHNGEGKHELSFTDADFAGRQLTESDFLGHLDYLNQKQYINAEFTGNAYANQEDVPDAANPKEFDARIANTYGAPDGPLPHLIAFKAAQLTEKGRKMLEKMEANPPKALEEGPAVPIATKDMPFLEKVMLKAELEDIFDARDLTEIVYRTMRDLMPTEAQDRVAEELKGEEALPTEEKALQNEIVDLWKDTNPIVGWLSRVRPPFHGPAPFIIDDNLFVFRVEQEGGVQSGISGETIVKAVFSATKDELSEERIQEIVEFLPGRIKEMWQQA